MRASLTHQSSSLIKDILSIALWLGLLTGLVEGLSLWLLQRLGWLSGPVVTLLGASPEIIWISAVFDLLLFGLVGLILGLLTRAFPRLPFLRLAAFLFFLLACFDWMAVLLGGRMKVYAMFVLALGLAFEAARRFSKHQAGLLRFWRRSLPVLGGTTLIALVAIQGGAWLKEARAIAALPAAAPASPNILVILVDALRADHLSNYGYERPTSPNIDRIAHQGTLFENAFSTSSWTKPSHASLLTGRYTYEHETEGWGSLDDRYPTISEVLQARGYRTGAFSANVWVFSRRYGFGRGFVHFEDHYRTINSDVVNTLYGRIIEYYVFHRVLGIDHKIDRRSAQDINQALLRWIERDPDRPFFAFINYYDVHDPYMPPQPYRSMFSELEKPGGLINTDWDMDHIYMPLTPEQLQGEIDAYDGAIACVDEHIGQLFSELHRRGMTENTLIVITSDHGDMFGEHGLFEHTNSLYREVIHVPLIFWWPGHLPTATRISQPVTNAALPATLMVLTGEDEQTMFPNSSLTRSWENHDGDLNWSYPIAELAQQGWVPVQNPSAHGAMRSVMSPRWHYITHEKFGEELYDWQVDPKELTNLAESSEFRSVADRFRTYLETYLANITTPAPR
jgi:arylsulfatase A-like enzyme